MLSASEYEPAVNEVQVPLLNREVCNLWLAYKELNVTDGMICAGYPDGGKDACQVYFYLPCRAQNSIFDASTIFDFEASKWRLLGLIISR